MKILMMVCLIVLSVTEVYSQDTTAADWIESGTGKLRLKDYQGSIDDFTNALKENPYNPEAYRYRGDAKKLLLDTAGAKADYAKAIKAFLHRAVKKDLFRLYDGAIEDYTNALQMDPKRASVYVDRGKLKARCDDYRGALEDFNSGLKLDPNLDEGYIARARVYLQLKQKTKAKADFKKATELGRTVTEDEWKACK